MPPEKIELHLGAPTEQYYADHMEYLRRQAVALEEISISLQTLVTLLKENA